MSSTSSSSSISIFLAFFLLLLFGTNKLKETTTVGTGTRLRLFGSDQQEAEQMQKRKRELQIELDSEPRRAKATICSCSSPPPSAFLKPQLNIPWIETEKFLDERSLVMLAATSRCDSIWKYVCMRDLMDSVADSIVPETQSMLSSLGCCVLTYGKTRIRISDLRLVRCPVCDFNTCDGALQTLDARHLELFLNQWYHYGSWQYEQVGADGASWAIFNVKHVKDCSTPDWMGIGAFSMAQQRLSFPARIPEEDETVFVPVYLLLCSKQNLQLVQCPVCDLIICDDWLRIGAFSIDTSVVLQTERLAIPARIPKEHETESLLQSTGCCVLDNVKTGIWIADLQRIRSPVCDLNTTDDWMRIGAFPKDSSVALLTERLSIPVRIPKEDETQSLLQSTDCCVLNNVKSGIWIAAGTMQILAARHIELFQNKGYYNGGWEYDLVGSHDNKKHGDGASWEIFDVKHLKDLQHLLCLISNHGSENHWTGNQELWLPYTQLMSVPIYRKKNEGLEVECHAMRAGAGGQIASIRISQQLL